MTIKGAGLVVFCCFLLHFRVLFDSVFLQANPNEFQTFIAITHCIALLLYPILGLFADSLFSRYKFVKVATLLVLLSSFFLFIYCLVGIVVVHFCGPTSMDPIPVYAKVIYILLVVTLVMGGGMFEANAVQFGIDQLVEASSDQLSAFIHWYTT